MSDASGATAWSYDSEGRALTERRTISGITKSIGYSYNLDGSLASLTYPSGRTVNYAYNGAARPLSAIDAANSINYATVATYAPQGALAGVKYGVAGGFTGIVTTNSYNPRLQPVLLSATAPSQTVLSLSYGFGLGTANNGNVLTIQNNRALERSQSFTYDQLNRVAAAISTATSGTNCWGESFGYDIWGNLLSRSAGQSGTGCTYEPLSLGVDGNNRILGFCYDYSGNLLRQGACGSSDYSYDAEGRITTTAGVSYTYDGDGQRVKKSSGSLYWYDLSGNVLMETNLSGQTLQVFVYFAGRRVATTDAWSGQPHYYFSDALGSTNVVTNADGTVIEEESDFYPFGGERVLTHSLWYQHYKFTGKERDDESGLDYFGARYYGSGWGRFMSPDEFPGGPVDAFSSNDPAPPGSLPYADITNPQSLNKYSYTFNNPLRYIDPNGHEIVLAGSSQDQEEARQRLIQNASKKGESTLFKTVTDKNGKTNLVLDKDKAANFKGAHSKGFNMLSQTINSKNTVTVKMDNMDSRTTFQGSNATVFLNRNVAAVDIVAPMRDAKGGVVPNPFNIIAGHEVLGHARLHLLGDPGAYADGPGSKTFKIENQLRREQGLPPRPDDAP